MKLIAITIGFIGADVVTGLIKALAQKNLDSAKLREGAVHKLAEVAAVGLAYLCQHIPTYMDIPATIPLLVPVCAYLVIMEIISCIENLCVANPNLAKVFGKYLEKLKEVGEK